MSIEHSKCDRRLWLSRRCGDIAENVAIGRLLLGVSVGFDETKFVEEEKEVFRVELSLQFGGKRRRRCYRHENYQTTPIHRRPLSHSRRRHWCDWESFNPSNFSILHNFHFSLSDCALDLLEKYENKWEDSVRLTVWSCSVWSCSESAQLEFKGEEVELVELWNLLDSAWHSVRTILIQPKYRQFDLCQESKIESSEHSRESRVKINITKSNASHPSHLKTITKEFSIDFDLHNGLFRVEAGKSRQTFGWTWLHWRLLAGDLCRLLDSLGEFINEWFSYDKCRISRGL